MIKTTLFISAAALTGAAGPTVAEQTMVPLPETKLVAQIAYLEVSHGPQGFELALGDSSSIFVDLEFPGDHHIRIGF